MKTYPLAYMVVLTVSGCNFSSKMSMVLGGLVRSLEDKYYAIKPNKIGHLLYYEKWF